MTSSVEDIVVKSTEDLTMLPVRASEVSMIMYACSAVHGFFRSIALSVENSLQDTLRCVHFHFIVHSFGEDTGALHCAGYFNHMNMYTVHEHVYCVSSSYNELINFFITSFFFLSFHILFSIQLILLSPLPLPWLIALTDFTYSCASTHNPCAPSPAQVTDTLV